MHIEGIKIKQASLNDLHSFTSIGTITVTLSNLKNIFGEPREVVDETSDNDKKTRIEWDFIMNDPDKSVFVILDYKRKEPWDMLASWNIYGKGNKTVIVDFLKYRKLIVRLDR